MILLQQDLCESLVKQFAWTTLKFGTVGSSNEKRHHKDPKALSGVNVLH